MMIEELTLTSFEVSELTSQILLKQIQIIQLNTKEEYKTYSL